MRQAYVVSGRWRRKIICTELVSQPLMPGTVRVKVNYIGVNFADTIVHKGLYAAAKNCTNITPGFEFVGEVIEASPQTHFHSGDKVFGLTLFGAYTTEIVVTQEQLRKIPAGWQAAEAAGMLVAHLTAMHALKSAAHLQAGDKVLVHSAAGGVGLALTQLALHRGLTVYGVVGTASKIAIVKYFGAVAVVLKDRCWHALNLLKAPLFQAIFDSNGITTPRKGLEHLNPTGSLVIYGFGDILPRRRSIQWLKILMQACRVPRISLLKLTAHNHAVVGFNLAFLFNHQQLLGTYFDQLLELMEQGKIKSLPSIIMPFNDVGSAHELICSGLSQGKIILQIDRGCP